MQVNGRQSRRICAKTEVPQNQSTSAEKPVDIGSVPDPHTNDPLKWRKFLWKYAGALAVFAVSFNSLRWYRKKLENEGARKREDVEISKTAVNETAADRAAQRAAEAAMQVRSEADGAPSVAVPEGIVPFGVRDPSAVSSTSKVDDVSMLSLTDVEEQTKDTARNVKNEIRSKLEGAENPSMEFRVFRPVTEQDNSTVSQEDELRLMELELEAKLKKLRSRKQRIREIDQEKQHVKNELKTVRSKLSAIGVSDSSTSESN